jgi:hypothetical protein
MISTELLGSLLKTPGTLTPAPPTPPTVSAGSSISELFEIYIQKGKFFEFLDMVR